MNHEEKVNKLGLSSRDLQKALRTRLDPEWDENSGRISRDQIVLSRLEDAEGEEGELWAIDVYDNCLYEAESALYSSEGEARSDYEKALTLCDAAKLYRIPAEWKMYGYVEVRAESLDEAVEEAIAASLPLGTYVDGSFEVDYEAVEDLRADLGED